MTLRRGPKLRACGSASCHDGSKRDDIGRLDTSIYRRDLYPLSGLARSRGVLCDRYLRVGTLLLRAKRFSGRAAWHSWLADIDDLGGDYILLSVQRGTRRLRQRRDTPVRSATVSGDRCLLPGADGRRGG